MGPSPPPSLEGSQPALTWQIERKQMALPWPECLDFFLHKMLTNGGGCGGVGVVGLLLLLLLLLFWCGGKVVHKNTTRLLKLGRKKLRCVDWAAQSAELWRPDYAVGDLCATGTYQLSRPVQRGEVIDYFVAWFAIVNPVISHVILLMLQKSGDHHLTCMKACKEWHIDHIKWLAGFLPSTAAMGKIE